MITPIGQRQILQTAAAEAVRAAQDGGEQVQREIARRQFLDQRLEEYQGEVHQVTSSENLRLEEYPKERKQGNRGTPEGESEEPSGPEEPGRAGSADSILDLLA